ncbi:MAG: hypothetical protein AB9903_35555 [Vulcanimicrobiota bacterium]
MKKFLIIAFAILILAVAFQATKMVSAAQDMSQDDSSMLLAAAGATLELQPIVIRKKNDENNIRVRVKNTGAVAASGLKDNLVIYLRVKHPTTGKWVELQKWSNIDSIKPGDTVSRDRTPVKATDSEMLSDKFTLQAEIVLKKAGTTKISKAIVENSYPEDSVKNP